MKLLRSIFQQGGGYTFVDKCIMKFLKQRSCDILRGLSFDRAVVIIETRNINIKANQELKNI